MKPTDKQILRMTPIELFYYALERANRAYNDRISVTYKKPLK